MNELRTARERLTLTQTEVAHRVAISRQALHAIETGRSQPGVDVALRLASVLKTSVEQLFTRAARLAPEGKRAQSGSRISARIATASNAVQGGRVALAQIDGQWVAHALGPRDDSAADGLVRRLRGRRVEVAPLSTLERAGRRLLVMGCAPALGLLASRLGDEVPLTWLNGGSTAALDALAHGDVHIAGIHRASDTPQPSRPDTLTVTLAGWELGLVVPRGNPKRLRQLADVARPGVRVVMREEGSRARSLLAATRAKIVQPLAYGHLEVAERVSLGLADAGVTIGSAAIAFGLSFVPIVEERFELIIPRRLARDVRIERLVDVLASRPFRSELDSLGGYFTT